MNYDSDQSDYSEQDNTVYYKYWDYDNESGNYIKMHRHEKFLKNDIIISNRFLLLLNSILLSIIIGIIIIYYIVFIVYHE